MPLHSALLGACWLAVWGAGGGAGWLGVGGGASGGVPGGGAFWPNIALEADAVPETQSSSSSSITVEAWEGKTARIQLAIPSFSCGRSTDERSVLSDRPRVEDPHE